MEKQMTFFLFFNKMKGHLGEQMGDMTVCDNVWICCQIFSFSLGRD